MLSNRKIAESRLKQSRGRNLYLLMPLVVLAVVVWEESGLQRWIYDELVYEIHFTKREGWSVWDYSSVLNNEQGNLECQWVDYLRGKQAFPMCIKPSSRDSYQDIIKKGYSYDCRAFRQVHFRKGSPNRNVVFVGGSDGACIMEFLINTDAKLVIFDKLNAFYLTSTLLKNVRFQDRVTLFPLDLSADTRLDDLILSGKAQIVSINSFADSNPCKLLEGMPSFLTKTLLLMVRIVEDVSECTPETLWSKLKELHFRAADGSKVRTSVQSFYFVAKNKKWME